MEPGTKSGELPFVEFVIIISLMMSLMALSIDAMMPALSQIGIDLHVQNANDRQLIISSIFLGLALGQLFFGPLSDKTGRKPAIYIGFGIYIVGVLLSIFSVNFPVMLAGRLLQGIGVSSPRSVTLAMVRDRYEGRLMARVMSFAMTVFILVPLIAPSLGQVILMVAGWRFIFVAFVIIALISLVWFALRMPETLPIEKRIPFSLQQIMTASITIIKMPVSLGNTIAAGLVGGAFLGYLNSAQQIFQEQYALGNLFPILFGIIALSLGLASFLNASLVMRFGMRFLVNLALRVVLGLAVVACAISLAWGGIPPLWFFMTYLMTTFFCIGILFGNLNALAMSPLGHIAGIGAAVVGSLSTLIQMSLGTLIGQRYNGTVLPVIVGIGLLIGFAILVESWSEKKQQKLEMQSIEIS
ncbi:MAG: multidrug effflux MFS transporter [Anaerolineaceae bacterium]|nr:multidrug effflux MFS transporter [Anaerolineaceae bacterium]